MVAIVEAGFNSMASELWTFDTFRYLLNRVNLGLLESKEIRACREIKETGDQLVKLDQEVV